MGDAGFHVERDHERVTLAFTGRLDTAGTLTVREAVLERIGEVTAAQSLRFDLAAVEFVASGFLRLCIQSVQALGSARFEVSRPTSLVHEVFVMAGLDRHLRITDAPVAG